MNRDGAKRSLWQNEPSYVPQKHNFIGAAYDVVVVGGGMTGVVTAYLLQQQGKRCLLAEANNLGFGTTGGTTAHLNTLLDTPYTTISSNFNKDTARLVADAASDAIKLIEGHINSLAIECEFARTEAYLFSQDEDETKELDRILNASLEAGLDAGYVLDLPIPVAFEKAVRFNDQAKFHPMKYLNGIAKAFESIGGQIVGQCRVTSVDESEEMLSISTSQGRISAKNIVYATHIPPGINLLHLRCAPWRSYAMAVKLSNGNYPDGLIYDMKDPYHYYRTQRIDGQDFLIAGGKDHKTGADEKTEKSFLTLSAHLQRIFDIADITHQWSSQYFESADGLPYIGVLPGVSERVYVATGFGGNGMIYSHVAAVELSHHILTGKSYYDESFSPSRIKPVAGFTNFVTHNSEVIKHFVGKWFATTHLEELSQLAPGEGKVVTFDGKRIALSKDENGKIHAVSPLCTHMKCNVAWNGAELSWDCPCHGARYSLDGKVLTGPADHDLETIELRELFSKAKASESES